jgi:hypothetical protein
MAPAAEADILERPHPKLSEGDCGSCPTTVLYHQTRWFKNARIDATVRVLQSRYTYKCYAVGVFEAWWSSAPKTR